MIPKLLVNVPAIPALVRLVSVGDTQSITLPVIDKASIGVSADCFLSNLGFLLEPVFEV